MATKHIMIVVSVIIVVLLILAGTKKISPLPPIPDTVWQKQSQSEWQKQYTKEMIENNIDLEYTQPQSTIDYFTEDLQKVISEMDSTSPEDAVKKATKFILKNIRYELSGISADFCYAETATSTLRDGFGDCVSMTKLGTAILRGQGIAVRSGGGCVKFTEQCASLMATFAIPYQKAEIYDGKKRGFLHEWAEVWFPEEGWVIVDFTSGAVYNKQCNEYTLYSYDNAHWKEMCVITDNSFIQQCREK